MGKFAQFTCRAAAHDDRGTRSLAVDANGRTEGRGGRCRGMAGLRNREVNLKQGERLKESGK